jgi:hypothetical protein
VKVFSFRHDGESPGPVDLEKISFFWDNLKQPGKIKRFFYTRCEQTDIQIPETGNGLFILGLHPDSGLSGIGPFPGF